MPTPSRKTTRLIARVSSALTLSASVIVAGSLALPSAASASQTQLQMIQDGGQLQLNPAGTLAKFRALGANTVRVVMFWYDIAPDPGSSKMPKFNATDPKAYPAANWALWDTIDRDAAADGIKVDFTVAGGSPTWADGPNIASGYKNPHEAWRPSAKDYGQFMQAVGTRYSGTFIPRGQSSPLPRVNMWALWNEPNFGACFIASPSARISAPRPRTVPGSRPGPGCTAIWSTPATRRCSRPVTARTRS